MKWKLLFFIFSVVTFIFICTSAQAEINDAAVKVKWGYIGNTGPIQWGQLDPSFKLCAQGKLQSPINIIKKTKNAQIPLIIHYQPAPLSIVKDGITDLLIGNVKTSIVDGESVQINFPSALKETITVDNKDYQLVQFHFHSPSENTWHDQNYPMEIHFVHQGENGEVAVMAVFIKGGEENLTLKKIIDHLPNEKGKLFSVQGETINPAALLPTSLSYYQFLGSLTTPPCSEGIQWLVLSNPIYASPAQILKLRKAMGGANARPVQPLHKRKIFFNQKVK